MKLHALWMLENKVVLKKLIKDKNKTTDKIQRSNLYYGLGLVTPTYWSRL